VSVEEQERKLITLVEEYRDRECSQLLDQANNTRQEMIRTAYRDARQHLHQAVERERARAISHIRSAEAELHTRRRAVEQREAESFLKQGWQILEQALMKQWHEDPLFTTLGRFYATDNGAGSERISLGDLWHEIEIGSHMLNSTGLNPGAVDTDIGYGT